MYFDYPNNEVWTTAKRVLEDLCDTLIALTYGTKTKFYNAIIIAKAQYVDQQKTSSNGIHSTCTNPTGNNSLQIIKKGRC